MRSQLFHIQYKYIALKQKVKMISALIFCCLFLPTIFSVKVFLMGGAVAQNQTQIYTNLASATGRKPNANNCEDDWKITPCPRIAVITSAAATEADGNNAYLIDQSGSLSYKSLFRLYGFSTKHVSAHIDNYRRTTDINNADGQYNLDIIKQADVLFFNGGDQSRHARTWLNNDGTRNQIMKIIYDRAMRDEVIISGTSAGSMVICNPIYGGGIAYGHLYFAQKVGLALKLVSDGDVNGTGLTDTRNGTKGIQYQDNGAIMPGFNLTPFLIDTHFDARGRLGRIVPAMVQTKNQIGVGVDQSTAFFYNNGIGTVYGKNGVYIADLVNAKKISKQYFAISNVTVSYLTSGDSYNLKTKITTPHSSKQLITKPAYSGYMDSSDILSGYQITKILTRLGDQTSSMNIGRSRIPSGYPSRSPVFKLSFQKTSLLKSYWSTTQRKYTTANVMVQYTYE